MKGSLVEKRTLGRTGLEVSVLGLGGHTYPVGPDGFCTHEERAGLVSRLIEGGVNYFDTTWVNEVELLADSFRRCGVSAGLHVSLQYVDGISDSRWRERLRGELEQRLQIMGYSNAPLFLMGVGNGQPPYAEIAAALEAMTRLKQEGLITNVGLSCHELSRFDDLADAIEQTDLIDYLLLRYNFKFQQAAGRLLDAAQSRNVGVVAMKVFCWDCGPGQWGRRISVFEPITAGARGSRSPEALAARESIQWVLSHPAVAAVVPAMNAPWEVEQNLEAVERLDSPVETGEMEGYLDRLWQPEQLALLARSAESDAIRQRAAALLQ